jgi:hypothetical protein
MADIDGKPDPFRGLKRGARPAPRGPRRVSDKQLLATAVPAILERTIEAALAGDMAAEQARKAALGALADMGLLDVAWRVAA